MKYDKEPYTLAMGHAHDNSNEMSKMIHNFRSKAIKYIHKQCK